MTANEPSSCLHTKIIEFRFPWKRLVSTSSITEALAVMSIGRMDDNLFQFRFDLLTSGER